MKTDPYMQCYLGGRCDPYDGDIDLDKLAERVMTGVTPLRDVCVAAAKRAIDSEMDLVARTSWLKDNLEEIKEMGGDDAKAYRLFLQGRIDNLAHQLEADVINTVEDMLEEAEPDEDDDDDSDEPDDQDEDGGEA